MKCSYTGCNVEVNYGRLCEYHKPLNEKYLGVDDFNSAIYELMRQGQFSFDGFIFPGEINFHERNFPKDISFKSSEFNGPAIFEKCTFIGNVDFEESRFFKGVSFKGARFEQKLNFAGARFCGKNQFHDFSPELCANLVACAFLKSVNFTKTIFHGGEIRFTNSRFDGDEVNFHLSIFYHAVDFGDCVFSGNSLFLGTKFRGPVFFTKTTLQNGSMKFIRSQFTGGEVDFSQSSINSELFFSEIAISYGISFIDSQFGQNSIFRIFDPKFSQPKANPIPILFKRVRFRAFQTFFEDIDKVGYYILENRVQMPLFAFRNCVLRGVYFSRCNMTLFSFYTSAFFEESFLISSCWPGVPEFSIIPLPYGRRVQICEELYYTRHKELLEAPEFHNLIKRIFLPNSFLEVAELYLRFKSAADKARDYHHASHFYQSEFEMKRKYWLYLAKYGGYGRGILHRIAYQSRSMLYFLYKHLAGYGEKPGLSFVWFILFFIIFSALNMFNGINTPYGAINYDVSWSIPNLTNLIVDIAISAIFSISRLVPINYMTLGGHYNSLSDFGKWEIILQFFNYFILGILIIFVGIGLKRHFRRF